MQGQLLAALAFGGALGAVARHLAVGQVALWAGPGFLFGTLAVHVVGSFAMGAIVELSALVWSPSPELRAFLPVGFLEIGRAACRDSVCQYVYISVVPCSL